MSFIWEEMIVLFVGYCLFRMMGKKTASEMTGLEIITLLSLASVIGNAVSEKGLLKTIITLFIFGALLIVIQYLAIRFNVVERLFMGKATLVIENGKILPKNLKKLRMSVDQLEAKLREKGISSFSEVKTGTIEMSGNLGYELTGQAKPVTIGELEKILEHYQQKSEEQKANNLFAEVVNNNHAQEIPKELN